MVEKERQHILPQFYQKGFSRDKKFIYVYDRVNNEFRKQPIRKTASIVDYYTAINPNGTKNKEIEDYFGFIESIASTALKKIDYGNKITESEKTYLSIFIAYLIVRGPYFEFFFNESTKEIGKRYAEEATSSVESVKKLMEEYEKGTGEKIEFTPEELFGSIGSIEVNVPKEFRLQSMLDIGYRLGILIFNMDWLIQFSNKKSSFITSDNPFIIFNYFGEDEIPVGIATPGKIKIVPLTSKFCLLLGNVHGKKSMFEFIKEDLSKKQTRLVNQDVAFNCERFILGKDKPLLEKIVKATGIHKFEIKSRVKVEYDGDLKEIRIKREKSYKDS